MREISRSHNILNITQKWWQRWEATTREGGRENPGKGPTVAGPTGFRSKDTDIDSDYVRKYFDVKKRAFLRNNMRDLGRFYATFLFVNYPRNNIYEIRAFVLKIMRVFPI